jgi:hypothetical protein
MFLDQILRGKKPPKPIMFRVYQNLPTFLFEMAPMSPPCHYSYIINKILKKEIVLGILDHLVYLRHG